MNICALGGGKRLPLLRAGLEYIASPPRVLIIPTACSTETSYTNKVASCVRAFVELGIPGVVLHDFEAVPTPTERTHKFGQATLLYVIGGNTPYLMRTLVEHGTDQAIINAAKTGTMLAGTSAGALLPFAQGHSCPVKNPEQGGWDYEMYPMLGLVRAAAAVHANERDPTKVSTRLESFAGLLPADMLGFAIDKNAALIITDEGSHVARSEPSAGIHVLSRQYHETAAPSISAITDDPYLTGLIGPLIEAHH